MTDFHKILSYSAIIFNLRNNLKKLIFKNNLLQFVLTFARDDRWRGNQNFTTNQVARIRTQANHAQLFETTFDLRSLQPIKSLYSLTNNLSTNQFT